MSRLQSTDLETETLGFHLAPPLVPLATWDLPQDLARHLPVCSAVPRSPRFQTPEAPGWLLRGGRS